MPPKRDARRPRLRGRPSRGTLIPRSPTRAPGFGVSEGGAQFEGSHSNEGAHSFPAMATRNSLTRCTNADQRTRFPSIIHRIREHVLGHYTGGRANALVPPYTRGSDSLFLSPNPLLSLTQPIHRVTKHRRIPVFQLPRRVRPVQPLVSRLSMVTLFQVKTARRGGSRSGGARDRRMTMLVRITFLMLYTVGLTLVHFSAPRVCIKREREKRVSVYEEAPGIRLVPVGVYESN